MNLQDLSIHLDIAREAECLYTIPGGHGGNKSECVASWLQEQW